MLNERAERIKQTLEYCTDSDKKCYNCPYDTGTASCIDEILDDCLALINEYEEELEILKGTK